MKDIILKVLGRRELMALILIISACIGFFMGLIPGETFIALPLSVSAFYFGQRGKTGEQTDSVQPTEGAE